ncbi:hypothetical protein HZ326_18523, partial [Fusarium oxysporum f. sp. albedinis]
MFDPRSEVFAVTNPSSRAVVTTLRGLNLRMAPYVHQDWMLCLKGVVSRIRPVR